jgi:hypothetical protein
MANYRDGDAGIRGRKNQTIRFSWIRPVLLRQEANPGHHRDEIQKVEIVVNRSIIQRLPDRATNA